MRVSRSWWKGVLVASALGFAACDDGFECGDGTVEEDGVCVPEDDRTAVCGPGTALNSEGRCVSDGSNCADGTTYNDGTGECEPNIANCAAGTVAMGDECVPDGSTICTGGTVYDPDSGTCVVSGEACAEGTTLIDHECVPNDGTLRGQVFPASEPDDPNFGGTPGDFLPPAIDEERTLQGCITPADFDMDGTTDYDADWFEFSVASPGLFRINADGLGGLAAGFAIIAADQPLIDQGFARVGLNLLGDSSERRVYLPRAGNYVFVVFDSRSINLDSLDSSIRFMRPVGNEETCYFVTIEAETIPAPTVLTDGAADGQLGDPQFFSVIADEDGTYRADLYEESLAARGGLSLSGPDTANTDTALALLPAVESRDELLIVVDPIYNISLDPVDWTLHVERVQSVPEDGVVSLTHDSTSPNIVSFNANAGDVVHLSFATGGDELLALVSGPGRTGGAALPCGGIPEFGLVFPCDEADFYFVVETSGDQLFILSNMDGTHGVDYDVMFQRRTQTPPTLAAGTGVDVTLVDDLTFVRVDTSASIWSRFTMSNFVGSAFTEVDVHLWSDEPGLIPNTPAMTRTAVTDSFGEIYGTTMGTPYLMAIEDPAGFDGDEKVNVRFDHEAVADVMVDATTPFNATGVAVPADGAAYYFVRCVPGGTLTLEVTGTAGTDPVIAPLDSDVQPLTTIDNTGVNGTETFITEVPLAGWIALAVTAGAAGGTVDVDISQTAPPYTAASGTSTFVSVCPAAGGTGSQLTMVDDDDGLSAVTMFSTFTSFPFFGSVVSGFVVSTNGWLTFDTSYGGHSKPTRDPLGTPGAPNNLVAPAWADLIMDQVCVSEDASQFIVEFNGITYTGTHTVQVQVIMLGDGSIEFVYGPSHTLVSAAATVGLENHDASIAIPAEVAMAPNSSILFTPRP